MATLRLNERRVDALKPRKSAYDIRDREVSSFGVRVLPSGAMRYFIRSQHQGRSLWKIVGHAGAIGADEAREQARTLVAAIRKGNEDEAAAPPDTQFETVADEVFGRYARNWKPSTLSVHRGYYRNQWTCPGLVDGHGFGRAGAACRARRHHRQRGQATSAQPRRGWSHRPVQLARLGGGNGIRSPHLSRPNRPRRGEVLRVPGLA